MGEYALVLKTLSRRLINLKLKFVEESRNRKELRVTILYSKSSITS
jgi:hypothetical protein